MEKIIFKNWRWKKLVWVLHKSKEQNPSMVIISHGFCANKSRYRLVKLAESLSNNNINAFRFDFSGCWESDKLDITIENQVDDLKSVINLLLKKGFWKIWLIWESLGWLISILSYSKIVKTMVLWAPVTKSKTPSILKDKSLQQQLNKYWYITYTKDNKVFKLPKKYFEERENINQQEILWKIQSPVLIIHWSEDKTVSVEDSKEAIKFLPKWSKLKIIKNWEHTLDSCLEQVIPMTVDWFKKYL